MKTPNMPYGKELLSLLILLLLTLSVLNILNVNIIGVSAYESPAIYIEPASTVDDTIVPGDIYTIAIKTDYDVNETTGFGDIWGWQFTLSYDPDVLNVGISTTDTWTGDGSATIFPVSTPPIALESEKVYVDGVLQTRNVNYIIDIQANAIDFTVAPANGTEVKAIYIGDGVTNGDLITKDKDSSAQFTHGIVNNIAGNISLTTGWFFYDAKPAYVTSGPGTLANVTFTVVGTGASNITLGPDTQLLGFTMVVNNQGWGEPYTIIHAENQPNQIGHGYFNNRGADVHDVAVDDVIAPAEPIAGENVTISVKLRNKGSENESVNVTVSYDNTLIGFNNTVKLPPGTSNVPFIWDTPAVTENKTYTITAEVSPVPGEVNTADNTGAIQIKLVARHDVSVKDGIEAPATAFVGDLVLINVTVANQGSFDENVTLTVKSKGVVILENRTLVEALTNETISFNWNTTGLTPDTYQIRARVTIEMEDDVDDNAEIHSIQLMASHDVAVASLSVPTEAFTGDEVHIDVDVENVGGFNENFTVTVYADTIITVVGDEITVGTQSDISLENGTSTTLTFSWNTTGVAEGVYFITAQAILDGDTNQKNNKRTTTPVNLKLPLGNIAGSVTDVSTGDPIEGANVTANGYSAITDATGHYNIIDVPAGTYTVIASADGYDSSETSITVDAGETASLNFTLTPLPGTINGTVKDSSTGDPIAGATVTIGGMSTTTDSSGDYTISNVPAGTYNITVSADGYRTDSKTGITVKRGETTTVDFELKPIQQINFLLYGGVAVAIIIIAGIAVYMLKVRKPT